MDVETHLFLGCEYSLPNLEQSNRQARSTTSLTAILGCAPLVEWTHKDGDYVHKGLKFGKVSRNAHKIVVDERVVLNFVQRKSGIATLTKILFHSFSSNWCGYIHLMNDIVGGLLKGKILGSSNAKCTNNLTGGNGDVDVTMLNDAVELINGGGETEASGNVTIETVGIHQWLRQRIRHRLRQDLVMEIKQD
ncbi:hypothetical protein F2Q69_00055548 [Brassica cretica]|uniref:Uncharacterized protein n=1 Tax=Brassica cretica TaxID=69181 RepID=A0A8S9MWM2_BRACR|nr:hypothetical protein F2Q69_00055548 [Brassica cretica]